MINYKIMKKQFFLCLLTVVCAATVHAQEVKMSSVPYPMHFENKAQDYKVLSENSIRIAAPAYTDLFISPDGRFSTDQSPRLVFTPDSNFILSAKITPNFKSKWDAGVLLIYNDNQHFAKFCFEADIKGQPRIVSVVCNGVADDCNSMPVGNENVYYRITGSTTRNTFCLYYLDENKGWFPVRSFRLDKSDNLRIGFSAQSPSGKGCKVDFSDISFQEIRSN
jgi:uncharacterized protein